MQLTAKVRLVLFVDNSVKLHLKGPIKHETLWSSTPSAAFSVRDWSNSIGVGEGRSREGGGYKSFGKGLVVQLPATHGGGSSFFLNRFWHTFNTINNRNTPFSSKGQNHFEPSMKKYTWLVWK